MSEIWNQLIRILPPPIEVSGLERTWEEVESDLECKLPADYKRFIDLYGSGCIVSDGCEFGSIIIWNFRSVHNISKWVASATRRYNDDRDSGYFHEYGGSPESDGLLGWGTTSEGDFFNWHMSGPPDRWGCVFYHFSGPEMIGMKGKGFTETLLGLLTHESVLLPSSLDPDALVPPFSYAEENW
jgi:hypothetical protein